MAGDHAQPRRGNTQIHSWNSGWRALKYVDQEEEDAFIAKEFMNSRDAIIFMNAGILVGTAFALTKSHNDATGRDTIIKVASISVLVQMLARVFLSNWQNQCLAARVYSGVTTAITFAQWLMITYIQRTTGYSILDSDDLSIAFFLCLGLSLIFLQGLVVSSANSYWAAGSVLQIPLFMLMCGVYLYPQLPNKLLLTKLDFFGVYTVIVLASVTLSLAQLHSRRVHSAQVNSLVEQMAKQRDRLHYDLCLAEKRAAGSVKSMGTFSVSALSSAVGELDAALSTDVQRCDTEDELQFELYPLRPQFFQEERSDEVVYLRLEEERATYQLSTRDGLLVDALGQKLAQTTPQSGMYVMDSSGRLLANFSPGHTGFHHSSFVAGKPVAAAGCMVVHDGYLLSLSNESGHYIPAPSSLSRVINRLAEIGLADLPSVRLDVVYNQAYDAPASHVPPAARPRTRASPRRHRQA